MKRMRLGAAARDLAALFGGGSAGNPSDGELLRRFVESRVGEESESAFAMLVGRHGPMVRGVCRRVVGDWHAAEDAFQAVFLVLARRAPRLRVDDSLGGWLYRVSVRVATQARTVHTGKRYLLGIDGLDPPGPAASTPHAEGAELIAAIDAEIARLPRRYREAVILCHVEGVDQREAARRLRCPLGTLQSRLHRARHRLRSGLIRRGLAPAGLAFALTGARGSIAGLIPSLVGRLIVKRAAWVAGVAIAVVGVGGGAYRGAGEDAPAKAAAKPARPSVAERLRALMDEFQQAESKIGAGRLTATDEE